MNHIHLIIVYHACYSVIDPLYYPTLSEYYSINNIYTPHKHTLNHAASFAFVLQIIYRKYIF